MGFIWLGTGHRFGWHNQNRLLFNPLCVLLLPDAWRLLRGRAPWGLLRPVLAAVAALAVVGLFLHWLPVQPQRNVHWIALLLPLHVAWWWALAPERTARPVS